MSIAQLQADKAELAEQLEIVLLTLKDDPKNVELIALKHELNNGISMYDESIAELKAAAKAADKAAVKAPPKQQAQPALEPSPEATPEHVGQISPATDEFVLDEQPAPAPKKAPVEEKEPEVLIRYNVNDTVMAKWLSGDKGFYPARITSVTGSSAAPIYTVKFKSYDNVETLRNKDLKPMPAANPAGTTGQKRKADDPPASPVGGGASATAYSMPQRAPTLARGERKDDGIVISATATRYVHPPAAEEADKAAAADDGKPPPRFKKMKKTKELEANQSKWQEFSTKSKFGKASQKKNKESMFRTPEGVNGRVGFVGSGQAMRKEATRSRHVYQHAEDLD